MYKQFMNFSQKVYKSFNDCMVSIAKNMKIKIELFDISLQNNSMARENLSFQSDESSTY